MGERLCFRGVVGWFQPRDPAGCPGADGRGSPWGGSPGFGSRVGGAGEGGWCDPDRGQASPLDCLRPRGGSEFKGLKEGGMNEERCSSEVCVHGSGGTSRPGSRLRPVRLVEGGGLSVVSLRRAREEGALCRAAFREHCPRGPVSGLRGIRVVPRRALPLLRDCLNTLRPCSRGGRPGRTGPLLSPAPSAELSGPPRPCGCCGLPQISL